MTDFSLVPAVIDALVALSKAALPTLAANNAVFDGPPTVDLPEQYAAIGYDVGVSGSGVGRPGLPAVSGGQEISDLGNNEVGEAFDVHCSVSSYSGDVDTAGQRLAALVLFNAIAGAIAADRSLGGVVPKPGKAVITRFEWYIEQGADMGGTSVSIMFAVSVAVDFVSWSGT